MRYIAHIRESDRQCQTVKEHLLEVKQLAEAYGAKLGVAHIAGLSGLLHDMGKLTEAFLNYITEAVNHPDAPPKRGSVDHSTAGGKLLFKRLHTGPIDINKAVLAEVVGNAIISHHSYLQDFLNQELESDYLQRVRDKSLDEYEQAEQRFFDQVMSEEEFQDYVNCAAAELEAYLEKEPSVSHEHKLMFLTKFIFSALIDADRTNTRVFEENKPEEPECDSEHLFARYYDRLMDKIRSFEEQNNADSPIHRLRREMSEQCDRFALRPPGIYTLSIPTGGGKTLASLRYALNHAKIYGQKRIIYVVPYTTIIEQNAAEVRRILRDDEHILEHHSNVVDDADDSDEAQDGMMTTQQKWRLAKDNWDSPVIFTTMVQFLNTFYAKGSRNIRRLHNLCNAVIIFDEVQKVPVPCVSLFNQALNFLKAYGRSSLVLCTATQPTLEYVKHKLDIHTEAEMIDNLDQVIEAFKRVEIVDQATMEPFDNERLAEFIADRLEDVRSVLVILNTKSVVRKLYDRLKITAGDIPLYHLSTSMCAAHRNEILEKVREHLRNRDKIICVSTQLIEAGVDVSFECVIRSLAGLDSIAQAAGRCNRHGEHELRHVYVIDHTEENLSRLPEIKAGRHISKKLLLDLRRDPAFHGGHLLSAQAMERYFNDLYTEFQSKLSYRVPSLGMDMIQLLTANKLDNTFFQDYCSKHGARLPLVLANSYYSAAEHFRVIDDRTTSVLVPHGDKGKSIIAELNGESRMADITRLLRSAQQFTINLYEHELRQLDHNNGLESCLDGKVLVLREGAYNDEFGLDLDNDSRFDLSIY
ncbi:CRISPR-associated nuclease/helicase Cas3 [Paenibacillus konkukensis]|uniref:CRISPR-associated nuclease/helicase Cas3 n=1 Tax=Paenibacillus konkukensis TaxID=2020716 RepID=A0ABY4RU16_9BACL|nr:CRISPR-associated helicase Cas3' [Paenibacillus konkukensis]UQZ85487.1 CRISPR-associated nuclease/helicase Cas3 [Paenibacillus konkukensis]